MGCGGLWEFVGVHEGLFGVCGVCVLYSWIHVMLLRKLSILFFVEIRVIYYDALCPNPDENSNHTSGYPHFFPSLSRWLDLFFFFFFFLF